MDGSSDWYIFYCDMEVLDPTLEGGLWWLSLEVWEVSWGPRHHGRLSRPVCCLHRYHVKLGFAEQRPQPHGVWDNLRSNLGSYFCVWLRPRLSCKLEIQNVATRLISAAQSCFFVNVTACSYSKHFLPLRLSIVQMMLYKRSLWGRHYGNYSVVLIYTSDGVHFEWDSVLMLVTLLRRTEEMMQKQISVRVGSHMGRF